MTSMSSCAEFVRWDVWIAEVAFEDDPSKAKIRPVVVLDEETFLVIALKVTSHAPRSGYRGEYEIKRWEDAGLFHRSTLRAGQPIIIRKAFMLKKIGRLHDEDIESIKDLMPEYRNRSVEVVGPTGFEPVTSAMSRRRHNP